MVQGLPEFPNGCFVTGTDTGVGKTFASAAMLHAMRRDGRPAEAAVGAEDQGGAIVHGYLR